MNTKKKALKWLLILVCVLLVCMFFARTLQTITTAKVQKINATRGKLEDRIAVKGEIRFSQGEPFTIEDARSLNIIVDKVMARPGYLIKPGDTLFTAYAPDFDSELGKIRTDYEKKVRELTVEVSGHLRLAQESDHNRAYNLVLSTTDDYYRKLFLAQRLPWRRTMPCPRILLSGASARRKPAKPAARQNQRPPLQMQQRPPPAETPAPIMTAAPTERGDGQPATTATPSPEEQRREADGRPQAGYAGCLRAKAAMDAPPSKLRRICQGNSPVRRIGDGVFDYIKDRRHARGHCQAVPPDAGTGDKKIALQNNRAPRLADRVYLKTGDKYDGSKPAYTLSKQGRPLCSAATSRILKPISRA